ncbi:hypothetical protein UT300012_24490 [Paraclostridium bifermentans]
MLEKKDIYSIEDLKYIARSLSKTITGSELGLEFKDLENGLGVIINLDKQVTNNIVFVLHFSKESAVVIEPNIMQAEYESLLYDYYDSFTCLDTESLFKEFYILVGASEYDGYNLEELKANVERLKNFWCLMQSCVSPERITDETLTYKKALANYEDSITIQDYCSAGAEFYKVIEQIESTDLIHPDVIGALDKELIEKNKFYSLFTTDNVEKDIKRKEDFMAYRCILEDALYSLEPSDFKEDLDKSQRTFLDFKDIIGMIDNLTLACNKIESLQIDSEVSTEIIQEIVELRNNVRADKLVLYKHRYNCTHVNALIENVNDLLNSYESKVSMYNEAVDALKIK